MNLSYKLFSLISPDNRLCQNPIKFGYIDGGRFFGLVGYKSANIIGLNVRLACGWPQ